MQRNAVNTWKCLHTETDTVFNQLLSLSFISSSSAVFHHLRSCSLTVSHPPPQGPPSVVFLQGLCFPLLTVMLISAVIRREGLNAAF